MIGLALLILFQTPLGRAIERGLLSVGTEDPRRHTQDVHKTVDDRPYGGGPGMVLKPEPMLAAIRAAQARVPQGSPRIYLSAQGAVLDQKGVEELTRLPGFVLVVAPEGQEAAEAARSEMSAVPVRGAH